MKSHAYESKSEALLQGGFTPDKFLAMLIVVVLLSPTNYVRETNSSAGDAVSVWSEVKIERADAYSTLNERVIEDCLRPNRVDCFSIQQNFWISDSAQNMVLWAQNTVELAKLEKGVYYGTFTFQVWSRSDTRRPALCEPASGRAGECRAPFYLEPAPFPKSFVLYSHIANDAPNYLLQMSNNFGSISWEIPSTVKCPCYIVAESENTPPWGHWPFELVAVGLDSSSTAVFRNDTVGSYGPFLIQTADGLWHEAEVDTIHCPMLGDCLRFLATAENSMNLRWNSTSREFYWNGAAFDQGVYISAISEKATQAPPLPDPRAATYLYIEFRSGYAYLTVYDGQHRALGVDPVSGKVVEAIANSSITHNSSEDLMIINPIGEYELVLTSAGNSPFELFVSKTTNTGHLLGTQRYNGTLNIGYSKTFQLNSADMKLTQQQTGLGAGLVPITGIILAVFGFVGVMGLILVLRRKRRDD